MTFDQVKPILTDLSLTIEVHPLALGVLLEDRGKFHLQEGILIVATIISNVISSNHANISAQFAKKKTFRLSTCTTKREAEPFCAPC